MVTTATAEANLRTRFAQVHRLGATLCSFTFAMAVFALY